MTPALVAITERQEECLWLVAQGISTEEIGRRMGLTQRGARYHVEELKRRFMVKTKLALIPYGQALDEWTVQAIKDRLNGEGNR